VALLLMLVAFGGGMAGASPSTSARVVMYGSGGPRLPSEVARAAAYSDPGVLPYGDAGFHGAPTDLYLRSPAVAMASTATGKGYWVVTANGDVYAYGDAVPYGSLGAVDLDAPVVGMAATPDGKGYWLAGLDGGVFSFGDARFYGSLGDIRLNQPVIGISSTPTGHGYWMFASDGGVFTFGDAGFYGSTGDVHLAAPIVGMSPTKSGHGYWLVGGDGGVFSFGDARFYGSLGATSISGWVTGMAATSTGGGYWLANANGDVYHFGDAVWRGDNLDTPRTEPIAQIVRTPDGGGYWLLEPDAFPTVFSSPGGGGRIVAIAAGQVRGDPISGYFCNPYGPCEPWCSLFATWVWRQDGIPIPSIPFVGDVYNWAVRNTAVLTPSQRPAPGDYVLYGTGPSNVATAVHMGIVAQIWPDGAIDTVEGDAGPAQEGAFNVVINGPFLPSDSPNYNGVPIFAFAVP
jgi:hypothetical protein